MNLRPFRGVVRRMHRFVAGWIAGIHGSPVFVLGNQKSGTTVIAALLARYAGTEATLDLRWQPPILLDEEYGSRAWLDALVRHHRLEFSRQVIKDPEFTFVYPQLATRFPSARFVFIVRDPRSNVRSILNRLDIAGDHDCLPTSALEGVNTEWKRVLTGRYLGIERDHYIDRLAARWNRAVGVYFEHGPEMELVRYEDFCEAKHETIQRLATKLGLPQVNTIDDALDVQYQPRGDRTISWSEFFGDNLNRIIRICGARMRCLDYEP